VWLGLGFAADALEQRHAALRKERLEVYMQVRRSPVYSVVRVRVRSRRTGAAARGTAQRAAGGVHAGAKEPSVQCG
jgi:hypothetical protein